jgi:hypothetical protein
MRAILSFVLIILCSCAGVPSDIAGRDSIRLAVALYWSSEHEGDRIVIDDDLMWSKEFQSRAVKFKEILGIGALEDKDSAYGIKFDEIEQHGRRARVGADTYFNGRFLEANEYSLHFSAHHWTVTKVRVVMIAETESTDDESSLIEAGESSPQHQL